MKLPDGPGFAVANNEDEHQALTASGYGPAFVAPSPAKASGGKSAKAAAEPAAE
jgi:hypothetical protein